MSMHIHRETRRRTGVTSCTAWLLGAALACLPGGLCSQPALAQAAGHDVVAAKQQGPASVPDHLLVGIQGGVTHAAARAMYTAAGATMIDDFDQIKVHLLRVPAQAREAVALALSHRPEVKFVELNVLAEGGLSPSDPGYSSQWHLPRIAAPTGWDISTGSAQVVVAVIDSGIDPAHADLASKLLPGYSFLTNTTDARDVLGHGTAVSGTAGAIAGNLTGVAGVAWQNPVLPLVVLDSTNYATYANIAAAIMYAADHGAKVMNISIGGSSYSSTLQSAVDYAWNKGAVIVASAMNNGSSTPMYPAALEHVMAVSATTSSDLLASFSNYGNWIDVAAPGASIYTTNRGGGYGYWNGTSFASPIVAGLAALVFAVQPNLTNTQVVDLIRQNSDDLGPAGYDPSFGYGRVNVYKTLLAAQAATPFVDTTPPTTSITAPAANSKISGTVTISVHAADNVGVTKVELYIDGKLYGTDTSAPYAFSWNTKRVTAGSHQLQSRAYDARGNVGSSALISVVK
ncbi:MAG: S8 family serine peptidase [Candidatus Tectimicrobiota bacterium]